VLTDLCNYNMPFIRYDIGDLLEVGEGSAPAVGERIRLWHVMDGFAM